MVSSHLEMYCSHLDMDSCHLQIDSSNLEMDSSRLEMDSCFLEMDSLSRSLLFFLQIFLPSQHLGNGESQRVLGIWLHLGHLLFP